MRTLSSVAILFLTSTSALGANFDHSYIDARHIYFDNYASFSWIFPNLATGPYTLTNNTPVANRSRGTADWYDGANAFTKSFVEQKKAGGHFVEADHDVDENQFGSVTVDLEIKSYDSDSGVVLAEMWAEVDDGTAVLEGRLEGSKWDWTYYEGTTEEDFGDQIPGPLNKTKTISFWPGSVINSYTMVDIETTTTATRRLKATVLIKP